MLDPITFRVVDITRPLGLTLHELRHDVGVLAINPKGHRLQALCHIAK